MDLWKAGENFRRGQNYLVAVDLLQAHLQCVPHAQSPPAIVSLGECYLSLCQYNSAINVLEECISTFPKHPETYRARLLASIAYCEKREPSEPAPADKSAPSPRKADLARARQLLVDNLHNTSLEPRSRFWQQSLLAYGKLLYRDAHNQEQLAERQRKAALDTETESDDQQALEELKVAHDLFQQAVRHLDSAVEREAHYAMQEGRTPQAYEAQYYVGEALRHSAKFKRYSLDFERSQSRRITLRQEMSDYLRRAAESYRLLQDQLARKQNDTVLSPVEDRLLRNSYFAYGDTLFELEDYDAAGAAYVVATNRYQRTARSVGGTGTVGQLFSETEPARGGAGHDDPGGIRALSHPGRCRLHTDNTIRPNRVGKVDCLAEIAVAPRAARSLTAAPRARATVFRRRRWAPELDRQQDLTWLTESCDCED